MRLNELSNEAAFWKHLKPKAGREKTSNEFKQLSKMPPFSYAISFSSTTGRALPLLWVLLGTAGVSAM